MRHGESLGEEDPPKGPVSQVGLESWADSTQKGLEKKGLPEGEDQTC